MSLQPHERILPAFDISEEGLRQLEIWLLERLVAGGGLQYHKGTYGPHNIGDWLDVSTTSLQALDTEHFGNIGQLFSSLANGFNFVWVAENPSSGKHAEWSFEAGGFLGYLDGGTDILYTQGGAIFRYAGGGDINFYTTDGTLNGAGDFFVITTGSLDNKAGDIHLDASGGDNSGNIQILAGSSGTTTLAGNGVDAGTQLIHNVVDPAVAQDAATKNYVDGTVAGSGAIKFATANSGTWLDVTTTGTDGSGYGINIEETAAVSGGINIQSVNGSIGVFAPTGQVFFLADDTTLDIQGTAAGGSQIIGFLGTGGLFEIGDHSGNPVSTVSENGSAVHNITTSGQTYVVNDHLGSPLVTYTG